MLVLVTYDVNTESPGGKKRLHRVAKICQNFGQRVQNSVFECLVDPSQLIELKYQIQKEIDNDKDSIRYYYLGSNWKRRVEHIGSKKTYDPEGLIIT